MITFDETADGTAKTVPPPKETITARGVNVPDKPSGDELVIKTRQIADSKKQKPLNVIRRYVRPHPAICMTPGCGRDLMREWISSLHPRKYEQYFGAETHKSSIKWEDLTQEIRDQLEKALKRHATTHDSGDYGPVKASSINDKPWTGAKKGMR